MRRNQMTQLSLVLVALGLVALYTPEVEGARSIADASVNQVVIDPNDSNTIYAAVQFFGEEGYHGGVFKSTDRGESWLAINRGLSDGVSTSLAVDPRDSNTIYVAIYNPLSTNGGIYKSTDGGGQWLRSGDASAVYALNTVAINPIDSGTIHAAGSNRFGPVVIKSTEGGGQWAEVSVNGLGHSFAIDPREPNTVYLGVNRIVGFGGILKSTDGGLNWFPTDTGLPNATVNSVVIDPRDSSILYAASLNGGIYKSVNGGESWRATGLAGGLVGKTLAIDAVDSNTIYAGISDTRQRVFKSIDAGDTWYEATRGLPDLGANSLAVDPNDACVVYAGTNQGVFKTSDGGESWSAVGQ